jgi:hypothetical protein
VLRIEAELRPVVGGQAEYQHGDGAQAGQQRSGGAKRMSVVHDTFLSQSGRVAIAAGQATRRHGRYPLRLDLSRQSSKP